MRQFLVLFSFLLLSACQTCDWAQVKEGATESEHRMTAGECKMEAERLLCRAIPKTKFEEDALMRRKDQIYGACMEKNGWQWIKKCR